MCLLLSHSPCRATLSLTLPPACCIYPFHYAATHWLSGSRYGRLLASHPPVQPSSRQTQPEQGRELLKMDRSQETGRQTRSLMEVGEARGCSSIISGSWYSGEFKYSLLYIIIRANFPFWNNVLQPINSNNPLCGNNGIPSQRDKMTRGWKRRKRPRHKLNVEHYCQVLYF